MSDIDRNAAQEALARQYYASLGMLREAIDLCSDDLWLDDRPKNAFWQLAYHTLFFAHLYLGVDEAAFTPWEEHQSEVQHPDGIAGRTDPGSTLPLIPEPYTRQQALRYCDHCLAMVDRTLAGTDLTSAESGFYWYRIPKLEHHLVNLRHIQHGAAQLADRLRAAQDVGVVWLGTASPPGG